ncbi:DUF433 domain-containing protein [Spirosoma validum]|uniref:DUF433 domain-containing protein n=1 Tax=Spirosoma validum TaxID=2771355 RepID=A0A927B110_9BACT|nr:DUF433 domain-containing protein [Spirosoma validum]MBD2753559.1 DUF433 domain-containing protein [Spirosoma validum]
MNVIHWRDYIISDPRIMLGKPTIKGTRITVELIVDRMSYGETIDDILEAYPHLTREGILACLRYAAYTLNHELDDYDVAA